jgi:hypothetical protein
MYIKTGKYIKYKHIISYVAPAIIQQPKGGTIKSGSLYILDVYLNNYKGVSFQWYKNSFPISGGTTNKLTISSASSTDSANYFCKISYKSISFNSDVVTLEVKYAPTIVTQPTNLNLTVGSTSALSVSATGTEPFFYIWYKNNQPLYATNDTYYFVNFQPTDVGEYKVRVYNDVGEVYSNTAIVSSI